MWSNMKSCVHSLAPLLDFVPLTPLQSGLPFFLPWKALSQVTCGLWWLGIVNMFQSSVYLTSAALVKSLSIVLALSLVCPLSSDGSIQLALLAGIPISLPHPLCTESPWVGLCSIPLTSSPCMLSVQSHPHHGFILSLISVSPNSLGSFIPKKQTFQRLSSLETPMVP